MNEQKMEEWAKYIYGLLGCDYWCNLSTGAICYLEKCEKRKNTAEHDFLKDIADLDVSVCYQYYNRQPLDYLISEWIKIIHKQEERFHEYDPIENTLMEIIFHKLYPKCDYTPNQYHPVRFYAEYNIKPKLEIFDKIRGEDIGGWCNVWDNELETHVLLNAYKKLAYSKPIEYPSREDTDKLLKEQEHIEQLTLW